MAQDNKSPTLIIEGKRGLAVYQRFQRNIENITDTELELCIKVGTHILKDLSNSNPSSAHSSPNPSLSSSPHSTQSKGPRPLCVVETPVVEDPTLERRTSVPGDLKLEDYLTTLLQASKLGHILTLFSLKAYQRARHASSRLHSISAELHALSHEKRNAEFWLHPENLKHKSRYEELITKDVRLGIYSHRGPEEAIFEKWLKSQDYKAWNRWLNQPAWMVGEWTEEMSWKEGWELPWLMAERERKGDVLFEGVRDGLEICWGNSQEERREWRWWVREKERMKCEKKKEQRLKQVRKELEKREKVLRVREVELQNERRALEKRCRELVQELGGQSLDMKSQSERLEDREQQLLRRKEEWDAEMREQELDLLARGIEPAPPSLSSIPLPDEEVTASNTAFERRYAQLAFSSSLEIFKDEELYRVEELGATIHTPDSSETFEEDYGAECNDEENEEIEEEDDGDFDDGASIHSVEIDRSQPFSWAAPPSSSDDDDENDTDSDNQSAPSQHDADFVIVTASHARKDGRIIEDSGTERICNTAGEKFVDHIEEGAHKINRRSLRGKKAVVRMKVPRTAQVPQGTKKIRLPPLEWGTD